MSSNESRPPSALEEILSSAVDRQVSEQRALQETLDAIRSSIDALRDSVDSPDAGSDAIVAAIEGLRAELPEAVPDPTPVLAEMLGSLRADMSERGADPGLAEAVESLQAELRDQAARSGVTEAIESLQAEFRDQAAGSGVTEAIESLRAEIRDQTPAGMAEAVEELKALLPAVPTDPGLRQSIDDLRETVRQHRVEAASPGALEGVRDEIRALRERRPEPDLELREDIRALRERRVEADPVLRDALESLRTRLPSDTAAELRHVLTDLRDSLRADIAEAREAASGHGGEELNEAIDALTERLIELKRDVGALRETAEDKPSDVLERAAVVDKLDDLASILGTMRGEVADGIGSVREQTSGTVEAVREEVSEALGSVREQTSGTVEAAREELSETLGTIRNEIGELGTAVLELNTGLQGWADRLQSRVGSLATTLVDGLNDLAATQRDALEELGHAMTRTSDALADRQEGLAEANRAALDDAAERITSGGDLRERLSAVVADAFGALGDDLAAVRERLQEGEDLTKYISDQVEDLDKVIGGLGEVPAKLEALIAQALRRASTVGAALDKEVETALGRALAPVSDRIDEMSASLDSVASDDSEGAELKRLGLRLVELESRVAEAHDALAGTLDELADEQREHRAELADALTELSAAAAGRASAAQPLQAKARGTAQRSARPRAGSGSTKAKTSATRSGSKRSASEQTKPKKKTSSAKKTSKAKKTSSAKKTTVRAKGSSGVKKKTGAAAKRSSRRRRSGDDYIPL